MIQSFLFKVYKDVLYTKPVKSIHLNAPDCSRILIRSRTGSVAKTTRRVECIWFLIVNWATVNYNIDKRVIKCESYVGGKKTLFIFSRCGVKYYILEFYFIFYFCLWSCCGYVLTSKLRDFISKYCVKDLKLWGIECLKFLLIGLKVVVNRLLHFVLVIDRHFRYM